MSVVESWGQRYGSNEEYVKSARVGFDYELNVAHPVKITAAKIIQTKREEVCLAIDVEILERGEVIGKAKEWFTLPKQVTDDRLAADVVRKLTFRRRDDIQRIFHGAEPQFAKFAKRELRDSKPVYFDETGAELDNKAYTEREKTVNAAIMEWCDAAHEQVGESVDMLIGVEFYIVKAPNKRNADYPYTNVYNMRPDTIPVLGEATDDDAPF